MLQATRFGAMSSNTTNPPPFAVSTSSYPASPYPSPYQGLKGSSLSPPLIDPITRKERKLESPYNDQLLYLTPWEKAKLNLRNIFVTMPKQIVYGLRGDHRFTYANFLNLSQIPYYLGGAVLAGSFAAGRDRVNFKRQLLGVGLYYLGMIAADKGINALYKMRFGVDLDQRYRKPNGDIDKVFASVDFPRFDLLKEADYEKLAKKMGVPTTIADPHQEVREQTRQIVSDARTNKLLLGNLLAALGAGYLARSAPLARLEARATLTALKHTWRGWTPAKLGEFSDRLIRSWQGIKVTPSLVMQDKLTGAPSEQNPLFRKSVLAAVGAFSALIGWHALRSNSNAHRNYESPLINRMSPALSQPLSETPRKRASSESNLSAPNLSDPSIFSPRSTPISTPEESAFSASGPMDATKNIQTTAPPQEQSISRSKVFSGFEQAKAFSGLINRGGIIQ